jgi:hypothetical protein
MKRNLATLAVALVLVMAFASVSLACGGGCTACSGCVKASDQCATTVTATTARVVTTGVASVASGVKSGVKSMPHFFSEVRRNAACQSCGARVAVHAASGRMSEACQKLSSEVRSLSLSVLHSAFSAFWALLSGLLHS